MMIRNEVIDLLKPSDLKSREVYNISNSIVKKLDFNNFEPNAQVIIENSIIFEMVIIGCWFREGLIFKGNHVFNYVDYQMGGHNYKPMVFNHNIFQEFFNFFDCDFTDDLVLEGNIFVKGCNIVGNKNAGWANSFKKEILLKNNIGSLDIEGIGITSD